MNISVVGYYGMGNFGDELFLRTFQQLFQGHKLFPNSVQLDPERIDAAIVGGGDLITPYHYSTYYFPEIIRRVPTWVYGVGIVDYYPEETWPAGEVDKYRQIIRTTNGLWVRDAQSEAIAKRHALHDRIAQVPDVAFAYRQPGWPMNIRRPTVGVCVFAYDGFPMEKVKRLLLRLHREGFGLLILPVIHHAANRFADMGVCRALKQAVLDEQPSAAITMPEDEFYLDRTCSYIQSVDYLISFKLHPALIALRNGVPVLCLSEMGKVRQLLRPYGLESFLCSYKDDETAIAERLDSLLRDGKSLLAAARPLIEQTERSAEACLLQLKREIEETAAG